MINRCIDKVEVWLFVIAMAAILFVMSCGERYDIPYKQETITLPVIIKDVTVAKRTKVIGLINYNGLGIEVDNGGTGYYYKTYNLEPNQIIDQTLTLSYYKDHMGYRLIISDLDLTKYEKK